MKPEELAFIERKTAEMKADAEKHTRVYSQDMLLAVTFVERLLEELKKCVS